MLSASHAAPPTEPATLADEIRAAAARNPETAVIVESASNPDSTTVADLFDESCRVAAGLTEAGIRPGDVVAVQLPNWRECIVAHAAVWIAGAVLLPIVPIYGPAEVAYILRTSGARALIIAAKLGHRDAGATLAAVSAIDTLLHRFVVGGALPSTTPYSALSDRRGCGVDFGESSPDQRCLLVYTSGTTAKPKGVAHTHTSLLAELRSIDQIRSATTPLSTLSVFPSGHIAGVMSILRSLTSSATTVAMDAWHPVVAAHLISKHRIGASAGAPVHLSQILDVAVRDKLDLSSLQEYTTGAAGVAGTLIRRADELGVRAFRCYGSTEHPTISSGFPSDPLDRRADTDGRLTPGTEVRLVDHDGRDVACGHDGEIFSRGPDLFIGYTEAQHNHAIDADGWFRTGDVGRIDAEGFLTITDRKKDIIVRGGENISSREVEDVLCAHPAVIDAAAIGSPDDVYGERVCAFVVLKPGQHFAEADAAEHFRRCGLALAKSPEQIITVDELPRTAGGKVQKHQLRQQLSGQGA